MYIMDELSRCHTDYICDICDQNLGPLQKTNETTEFAEIRRRKSLSFPAILVISAA